MSDFISSVGNSVEPFHRFPVIIGNIRIPLFFKFTQNPNSLKFTMEKEYNQTKTIGGYVFEHWGKKPTVMQGTVLIKKDQATSNLIGLNTSATNFGIEDAVFNPELTTLMTLFNIDQRKIGTSMLGKNAEKIVSNGVTYAVSATAALTNPYTVVASGLGAAHEIFGKGNSNYKFKEPDPSTISGYLDTLTDTIILYKGVIYSGFFIKMNYSEDGTTPFTNKVDFSFLVTNTTSDWLDTSLTQTAVGRTIAGLWGATTSIVTIGSMISDIFKNTGSDTHGHV